MPLVFKTKKALESKEAGSTNSEEVVPYLPFQHLSEK